MSFRRRSYENVLMALLLVWLVGCSWVVFPIPTVACYTRMLLKPFHCPIRRCRVFARCGCQRCCFEHLHVVFPHNFREGCFQSKQSVHIVQESSRVCIMYRSPLVCALSRCISGRSPNQQLRQNRDIVCDVASPHPILRLPAWPWSFDHPFFMPLPVPS